VPSLVGVPPVPPVRIRAARARGRTRCSLRLRICSVRANDCVHASPRGSRVVPVTIDRRGREATFER